MTENEALDLLRAQGYAVGAPDPSGNVRIWIGNTDTSIIVGPGPDLWDLAEGKMTPAELLARGRPKAAAAR